MTVPDGSESTKQAVCAAVCSSILVPGESVLGKHRLQPKQDKSACPERSTWEEGGGITTASFLSQLVYI